MSAQVPRRADVISLSGFELSCVQSGKETHTHTSVLSFTLVLSSLHSLRLSRAAAEEELLVFPMFFMSNIFFFLLCYDARLPKPHTYTHLPASSFSLLSIHHLLFRYLTYEAKHFLVLLSNFVCVQLYVQVFLSALPQKPFHWVGCWKKRKESGGEVGVCVCVGVWGG